MIYPTNFEFKIGFNEIRTLLKKHCMSIPGKELADGLAFQTQADTINTQLEQIREFRRLQQLDEEIPFSSFSDLRETLKRIRIEGSFMEEEELFDLRRSLDTTRRLKEFLTRGTAAATASQPTEPNENEKDTAEALFPALAALTEGVITFPLIIQRIDQLLDKFGHIRDTASPDLARIRRELARTQGSISGILNGILQAAQRDGLLDKDVTPTMRDGRLMIPVVPQMKRKIQGIVHDESTSGRTVYIEPTEVVEANNHIRELEAEERQEIVRLLKETTKLVRPHVAEILYSYRFLAYMDLVQAKAELANESDAFEPTVVDTPVTDWIRARHPLLEQKLKRGAEADRDIVPLDITLTPEKHILIISGPNAGGKSVCLKTVGLLQYMVQCGLSIPVGDRSKVGIYQDLMIDIGDEQSLENDLSTYSSHLLNMKNMMRQASDKTLILIDEFGTGTEPQIGGAIAESVLNQFCRRGAWAVITTHYQNLKHFADTHEGVANGAMLYDRHEMRPLFQLSIGRPGSSFAIEIARKIGLPEEVIAEASDIVGSDYIQSDKYLQDIVRDKRYWEAKRQAIHQREKELERTMQRYETGLTDMERQRKEILRKAKDEAMQLLAESNKKIENTIREIKEKQAQKEETRNIRTQLNEFKQQVANVDTKAKDEEIARKIEQIKQRKERHQKHKEEKANRQKLAAETLRKAVMRPSEEDLKPKVGDTVRMKGLSSVGTLESIDGKMAVVIFGGMRTKLRLDRIEKYLPHPADGTAEQPANKTKAAELQESLQSYNMSHMTQETLDSHKRNFHQDLDVRGMRGNEALNAVQYFIDDAILVGMARVRILHGKGNGILRQLIRDYLASIPNITRYADEHVQFGGAGITVVDIG